MMQSSWFESPRAFNSIYPTNNHFPFPQVSPTLSLSARYSSIERPNIAILQTIIFESDLQSIISSDSNSSISESSYSESSVISESSKSELSMLSIEESLCFATTRQDNMDLCVVGKSMPIHQQTRKIQERSRNRLRGLKTISQRIWMMLDALKAVRQDQVATRLLLYLNGQEFKGQDREEQNIKKRVVDALSILIASGEITKNAKKLAIKQDKKVRKVTESHLAEINALRKKLTKKQETLASKRQKLREFKAKRKVLKKLLERNQNSKKGNKAKIPFPFIGVMYGNSETKIEQPSNDKAWISSSMPINIFGDIDSLRWLKNDTVQERLNQISPKK